MTVVVKAKLICCDIYTLVETKFEVLIHATATFRVLHGKSLIEGKKK